jgi:hypothetical protein
MNVDHVSVPFLALVSFVSSPLPVIVGWIRRKYLSRGSRVLLGLLAFYLLFLPTQLAMLFSDANTHWLSQLYVFLEFCTIAIVLLLEIDDAHVRAAIKWAIFMYCTFWLMAKFTIEPLTLYDNYTGPFAAVLLIVIATYKLIELLREGRESVFRKSMFWISTGIIVYYVGTMPLVSLANMLLTRPLEEFANFWKINWGLAIVSNLIYTKAFTCKL